MKKSGLFWIVVIIFLAAEVCSLINSLVTPLPDGLVITSGILTILSLPVIVYKAVRWHIERSK